ncbi:MAG TPA: TIGR03560 family F420-dependent LLM class oxidoreductase [Ktedonobacteraceae bacterium]
MVEISLMIEGQNGLNWSRWQRLVEEAEKLGFAGVFRSDHFTNQQKPDLDSLEMIVSLAYLADHTRSIHFGPLVAPLSFRDPVMLARQATAIDDLSNGRMILGLGAGWQEREHTLFGYHLGDVGERMSRFAEGLEVITRLRKSDEPVSFAGQFFQLHEALLLPRPRRSGGPRIMIGGNGPKRTLPLAARYADIWNAVFISPTDFYERSQQLDRLLTAAGRQPADVKRTAMTAVIFARADAGIERRLTWQRSRPELADLPLPQLIEQMVSKGLALCGNAEQILSQIQLYTQAGAQELMLQWPDLDDIEGLRAFASDVLPHLA